MMVSLTLLVLAVVSGPCLGEHLPFIIGGEEANSPTDWPWQCSLRSRGSHFCGASIISSKWLVTAAHCSASDLSVKCGSIYRTSGGVKRNVKTRIRHEDYGKGEGNFPNDIAVLELAVELPLSDTIAAIPLATTDPAGNKDCYITGWGINQIGSSRLPYLLEQAKIEVYTQDYCKRSWGSDGINPGHVCVGDLVNGRGACNGDSGGPLVCRIDGVYKLVGAASWVESGYYATSPSVYTRVSYFKDWIKEKTGV